MADFVAMPLRALAAQGPIVVRARHYRVSWPHRLVGPAMSALPGAVPVQVGTARTISGGAAFSVAPGECHVLLEDAATGFVTIPAALTTDCSDSHLQWRLQPDDLDALVAAYAAFALPRLTPGSATALSIAGERMLLARPGNGPVWLFHEVALQEWFISLLLRIGIHSTVF